MEFKVLKVTAQGNVELFNEKGQKLKVVYAGKDATRADWISEKDQLAQIWTKDGKIKQVNKMGQVIRTI